MLWNVLVEFVGQTRGHQKLGAEKADFTRLIPQWKPDSFRLADDPRIEWAQSFRVPGLARRCPNLWPRVPKRTVQTNSSHT